MTSKPTLFIVYNASGSLLGHATYAYHHLRQSPGKDCSACALTHGPSLSLSESTGWTALKAQLETGGVEGMQGRGVIVKQLHTEDLTDQIKGHMKDESLVLPCILVEKSGSLSTVLKKSELDGFGGDQAKFEDALGKNLGPIL